MTNLALKRAAKARTPAASPADQLPAEPSTGRRTYVLESHTFTTQLETRRREECRRIDTLDSEIADLQTQVARLTAEIDARQDHRDELQNIVAQIDAALAVGPRPVPTRSPVFTEHKE